MGQVTGIGGAFLRAKDPKALYEWYEKHLGLTRRDGCFGFDPAQQRARVVVAFFAANSDYFPVAQPAMLNFHVDDLDAVLDGLTAAGVEVDPKRDRYDFGDFGWFTDPEGNRVELWQPKNR
jgi:predicted enzyme related to lactoylglutathione lyase